MFIIHSSQINPKIKTKVGRVPVYRTFIVFLILLLSACAGRHQPPQFTVEPLPLYEALFQRNQGWTGGDGVFSVGLDPNRVLWLFGDTFIGEVKEGRHIDAVLVNNSIAIQKGKDPLTSGINFYYGEAVKDKPEAFFRPSDGVGWFWPYHGVRTKDGLFLFLIQIERTDGHRVLISGPWPPGWARSATRMILPKAGRFHSRRFPGPEKTGFGGLRFWSKERTAMSSALWMKLPVGSDKTNWSWPGYRRPGLWISISGVSMPTGNG